MKQRYRITPQGAPRISDAEIAKHKDARRLIYNYHRATHRPKRPIYRDPKAFLLLLFIVLIAYLISEERHKPAAPPTPPAQQGTVPQ